MYLLTNQIEYLLSLCMIFQKWLIGSVVTKKKIDEAASIVDAHLGPGVFNYDGDLCVCAMHEYVGYLFVLQCSYSYTCM